MQRVEILAAELQGDFASLLESHKRLRSRTGMRELRERRAAEEPNETPEQWKARMRLELATKRR